MASVKSIPSLFLYFVCAVGPAMMLCLLIFSDSWLTPDVISSGGSDHWHDVDDIHLTVVETRRNETEVAVAHFSLQDYENEVPMSVTHRLQRGTVPDSSVESEKDATHQNSNKIRASIEERKGLERVTKSPASVRSGSSSGHTGYLLAVNYYEQQTMGSRNMIQLQCLARHLKAAVVKPVMKDSLLRTPLNDAYQRDFIKFEDSFDLGEWMEQARRAGYAPLVEWEQFLVQAPHDVILVQFNYPSVSMVKEMKKKEGVATHRAQNGRHKSGCAPNWPSMTELAFLKRKRFSIVRQVCFNFIYGDTVTLEEFDEHMLGGYSSTNVTIVMDMWRGLGSEQRVLIAGGGGGCTAIDLIHERIRPSQCLVEDAEEYIRRYLKGGPFIAVMGRLEMSLLTVYKKISVSYCFKETYSSLLDLQKETWMNETFLSIDIGQYGTKKWRHGMDREMATDFQEFLSSVYGREISVKNWESTFSSTSSFADSGYIGLLQKVIVTRARCILFVGGGAFQRHTLHLYRQLNPDKSRQCLRVVKPCTSATKLAL